MAKILNEQAFNLQFVYEVEKRPELYNYNLASYSRKDVVEKAWNEVGLAMNLSALECRERWKNIRSVFVRSLKLLNRSDSAKKQRRPYYLMEALHFTLPFIKFHKNSYSGDLPEFHAAPPEQQLEEIEEFGEEESIDLKPIPIHVSLLDSPSSSLSPSIIESQPSPSTSNATANPLSFPKKKKTGPKREVSSDEESSFIEFRKAKKAKLDLKKSEKLMGIKSFVDSLIPELETLTEDQMKSFRRRVFSLIDDITSSSPPTQ